VKSPQIVLGIAVLGLIASAVGSFVTAGPRAALSPAIGAVVFGVILYKIVRNPPAPTRWTRQRVVASAAIYAVSGLAMIVTLVWVLTVRPEWPIRIVAVIGILLVPTLGLWLVRVARAQDRAARLSGQGPSTE
jgi:integral membrane sensor domain MASE1